MATEAGVNMSPCRLHNEDDRSHFMTKRFDRYGKDGKRHMQSLGAIAHYDYNQPASYSYEQAIQVIRRLELPREDLEQQVLRAFFNVVGCNRDDHVKNIAFTPTLQNPEIYPGINALTATLVKITRYYLYFAMLFMQLRGLL